jgi:competence protein ComEC
LDQIRKVGEGGSASLKKLYRWRDTIRERILASLSGEPAALLMALIIGETGGLTNDTRDLFAASGTTHILSISGSHLALVAFLVFGSVRWLILRLPVPWLLRLSLVKLPSQWAAPVTACAVSGYALLAGAEIATLRSLIMVLVYLFSVWIVRSSDAKISLAVAALLILAFHPQAIFDISFQLSFLSVLAILMTLEWWNATFPPQETTAETSWVRRHLIGPARLMLLSTLGATIGTAPLTLCYFHQFSWVGLLANPLIVPLAGGLIVPLGLLSALATPFVAEGFPLAGLHQTLGTFYFGAVSWFARIPGGDFHAASPPFVTVILFYGVIAFLIVKRVSWKPLLLTLLVFFSVFLGWGSLRFPPQTLRVTFLDVGQGDATLFEFSDGKVMLVDAGSGGDFDVGRAAVAPYLWQRRIRTIDVLVGTHPQMDHMGGMDFIAKKFAVREVWTNGMESDSEFYRVFQETLRQRGLIPKAVHEGTSPLQLGGCRVDFLNPPEARPMPVLGPMPGPIPGKRMSRQINNHSIVFRMDCPAPENNFSVLMTGDIEKEAEKRLLGSHLPLRSTILKVPHHGSRGARDAAFLDAVSPRFAVVSAGQRNRYRHPHPEVLADYRAAGIPLYRTDQDGALFVEGDRIRSHRAERTQKITRNGGFSQEWGNIKRALRGSG